MGINIQTFGFDPGLRHGAVVRANWWRSHDEKARMELMSVQVPVTWTKKNSFAIGQKSPLEDVYTLVELICGGILDAVTDYTRPPIGIDWTRFSVHMKSRKLQAVQLAFMLGYFTRLMHEHNFPVVFLSPHQVRKCLESGAKVKAELWQAFIENWADLGSYSDVFKNPKDTDLRDALILSYVIAVKEEVAGVSPAQARLPSR